ncbi:MAG TPA: exodeoxyribonuclease III [Methylovirgula sp.]|nr:exodeoxyribonuclease III [Methylovirgula sp.]
MRLTLASWNINSVRLRIGLLAKFLASHAPDVICLQETKCRDGEFPASALRKLGYDHIAVNGQKGYHGVAVASKLPFATIEKRGFCDKGDARHISVILRPLKDREIALHNFYVPAGGDEPDPDANPKFAHKLAFLDEMADWIRTDKIAGSDAIMLGDLNIAPLETDVWNHKALLKVVSHTPIEVERLGKVFDAGPWVDALRRYVPLSEKLYTWWSYRAPDWAKSNKGRRLDHIWLSESLSSNLSGMKVLRESRGWERPSDHVPVMAHLDF